MRNLLQKNIKGINGAIGNSGFVCCYRGQVATWRSWERGKPLYFRDVFHITKFDIHIWDKKKKENQYFQDCLKIEMYPLSQVNILIGVSGSIDVESPRWAAEKP